MPENINAIKKVLIIERTHHITATLLVNHIKIDDITVYGLKLLAHQLKGLISAAKERNINLQDLLHDSEIDKIWERLFESTKLELDFILADDK